MGSLPALSFVWFRFVLFWAVGLSVFAVLTLSEGGFGRGRGCLFFHFFSIIGVIGAATFVVAAGRANLSPSNTEE